MAPPRTRAPMDDFSTAVKRIIDDFLKHEPIRATLAGMHDHDRRLPDLTQDGYKDADLRAKAYLATLDRFPIDKLSDAERIDRAILVSRFQTDIREHAEVANHRHDPSLYPNVALMGIYSLLMQDFAPIQERMPSVEARLNGIPGVFAAARTNLIRSPAIWNEIAMEEVEGGIEFLASEVQPLCDAYAPLREPLERAVESFREYGRFLSQEHALRDGMSFSLGRDMFDFKLKTEHLLPYDSESLLAFGDTEMRDTIEALQRTA